MDYINGQYKANKAHELEMEAHNVFVVSSDRNHDYGQDDHRRGRGHGGVAILARKEIKVVPAGAADDIRIVPVLVRGEI